jgi:hypothetical protein
MNPVAVQILNQVEKQRRSDQAEALQLRKQSRAARSRWSIPLKVALDGFAMRVKLAVQQLGACLRTPALVRERPKPQEASSSRREVQPCTAES